MRDRYCYVEIEAGDGNPVLLASHVLPFDEFKEKVAYALSMATVSEHQEFFKWTMIGCLTSSMVDEDCGHRSVTAGNQFNRDKPFYPIGIKVDFHTKKVSLRSLVDGGILKQFTFDHFIGNPEGILV